MKAHPRLHIFACMIVLLAVILSSCIGTPATNPASPTQASDQSTEANANTAVPSQPEVQTDGFDKLGPVTLRVVSGEAVDTQKLRLEEPTKAFEALYPNVKVEIEFKDFNTHLQTIKLVMQDANPPDVVHGNQGYDIMGSLIKAGLVTNLDKYAKVHGWEQKFSAEVIQPNRFSTDGKIFGEGSLWAVSQAVEYTGVFYNKANLAKIGISDVKSLDSIDAFEAALQKAKDAGLVPIILGDSDKWPANHSYSIMEGLFIDPKLHNDWVFGKAGSDITPACLQAGQKLQGWVNKGYFNPDILAISYDDSIARFTKGEGVFYIGGVWATSSIYTGLKDDAGWMLHPPGKSGQHISIGSINLPLMISSKSKYQDLAAAYLNFITTSDEAVNSMLKNGSLPAIGLTSDKKASDPLTQMLIDEYSRLIKDKGLEAWQDWATPRMYDLMSSNTQSLIGGQMTAGDYCKSLQDDWNTFQSSR